MDFQASGKVFLAPLAGVTDRAFREILILFSKRLDNLVKMW